MQQPVTTCPVSKNEGRTHVNDVLQRLTDVFGELRSNAKPQLENIISTNHFVLQFLNSANQITNEEDMARIIHQLLLLNKLVLQKHVKANQQPTPFINTVEALSKLAYALIKEAEKNAKLPETTIAGKILIISLQIAKIVELAIINTATPITKKALQRNLNNMILIQNNAQWNLGIAFVNTAEDHLIESTKIEAYKTALRNLECGITTTLLKNNNDLTKLDEKWPTYLLQVCRAACELTKDKVYCAADHLFFMQEEQRLTKTFGKTESVKKIKTEHSNSVNATNPVISKQTFFQAPASSAPDKVPLSIRYNPDKLPFKKRLFATFSQD